MKILINTPDLSLSGGVANHYKGLLKFWSCHVRYNYVGGRKGIPGAIVLPFDFIKFMVICSWRNYDIIVLNPSLGKTAIARDAVFLKIANIFNTKCIVFWHGWSPQMASKIDKQPAWFSKKFKKADLHLVLSKSFKSDLIKWGITSPIELTTTKVDDDLVSSFDIGNKQFNESTILFLTRIEIYKGIFIALDAFHQSQKKYPRIKFVIAGDGSQLQAAEDFVYEKNIKNVTFLGNLHNEQLIDAFMNAAIYILPTYNEGLPTSVLEAMAFGLPVITRPVGGLNDFFEDSKMGYLIESINPIDFSEKIAYLIENPKTVKEIGEYNHRYAKQHFMASEVAQNLEVFFKMVFLNDSMAK